jgi:RNA polymerase sigma-70 factor (ECF subfamily)
MNSAGSFEALEILCRRYWSPIYAFIQRRGFSPVDAQDLTQEFFARLLEKNSIQAADSSKGKFRTFLLTALTRFLINEGERGQAQKRGGGCVHLSLDDFDAEDRRRLEPAANETPVTIYERRWAEALLESVLSRLREEYESAGDRERFDILKPFLVAEKQASSGAEIGALLGLTESAVYSAVHRLRKRYGELLQEEIAHTVNSANEIEAELRYLVQVLSR